MTEKEKKKRFETVRKTHDELKQHPYWISFDRSLLPDVTALFRKISDNYWGISDDTNPYYAIISRVTHDFNCMLWTVEEHIRQGVFDETYGPHMGDINMVLQVYLMNIHRLVEAREPDGNVVGYTYSTTRGIIKFQAFPGEDGKWSVYNIIGEDRVPKLIEYLNKYAGLEHDSNMKTWAVGCLKEIEDGKDVIGKVWKIVK